MTSISCCNANCDDGTPCGCQFTREELKTEKNGIFIYCKNNDPLICGTCSHGTGFHPPGQISHAPAPQLGKNLLLMFYEVNNHPLR
jgi:hypothetical protein